MILATTLLPALLWGVSGTTAESDMVTRINDIRRNSGLQPVVRALPLDEAAGWFAADLALRGGQLDHVDSQGRRVRHRIYEFGYRAIRKASENLAMGTTDAKSTVDAWMNSPGHRRNLLDADIEHVGVGIRTDEQGRNYWVLELAQRFKGAPPVPRSGT